MNEKGLVPLAVALALACGSTAPTVDVSGLWDWTATFTSTELSITCVTSGTILLAQSEGGGRVTGVRAAPVATCEGGPDTLEDRLQLPANVLNAEVSGNEITMEIAFCDYQGTVTMGTPNGDVMSGTIECPGGLAGESGLFTGTWEASR